MCFHSKQTKDALTLEKRFNAKIEQTEMFHSGDFNGFMHPYTPIITNNRQEIIQFAQWGLIPEWAKDKSIQNSTLNAKLETINEKPSFKNCVSQRCLIPADGFYEWQWLDTKGKRKQKYLVHLPGDDLYSYAGLWNVWKEDKTGETLHTYTILTTEANGLMAVIHNSKKRMPLIINPNYEKKWLDVGQMNLFNDYLVADPLRAAGDQLDLFDEL
jgi:putative SOS response-associated peptidase YedK